MNKILIAVNGILVIAVAFLFYKVYGSTDSGSTTVEGAKKEETAASPIVQPQPVAGPVTGKIAYVNIDKLNDQSQEISELVTETKRRKDNIEAAFESLSLQYEKKVEEFQSSQKAGIAGESQLQAKAKEIQSLEQDARNKQVQMDNLTLEITEKNNGFQKSVKNFLTKWNDGRFDYILSYSDAIPSLLVGNPSLDVTDEVIKLLNEEYKGRKKGRK
jgi:outer membrane protein